MPLIFLSLFIGGDEIRFGEGILNERAKSRPFNSVSHYSSLINDRAFYQQFYNIVLTIRKGKGFL